MAAKTVTITVRRVWFSDDGTPAETRTATAEWEGEAPNSEVLEALVYGMTLGLTADDGDEEGFVLQSEDEDDEGDSWKKS